jgi:GTP-binding protein
MSPQRLAIIAIVGRPNVGKSRLFNRYAGQSRALVDDRPGITRDRIAEEIELLGRRFLLVDTAGFDPEAEEDLEAAVQAQAEMAVEQADAILFVVDGKAGLLPQDEAIARTLRRSGKPLAVAVNKIDQPSHLERAHDFHGLGFERLAGVSAEHGSGCFDLLEQLVQALPDEPEPTAEDAPSEEIRVALVGRPNVGKSSLTNRIAGDDRVVVSHRPGTTRDRVDIPLEQDGFRLLLMDTAGLRRPGRRHRTAERGSALMTVRSLELAHVGVLVIDASEGVTDQDAHVGAEICERGCAAVVLANKWDLVGGEGRDGKTILAQIEHGLRFMPQVAIVPVSAKTGARLQRFLPAVRAAAAAAERRIPTADLNRWLQQVVRMHEPAVDRRGGRTRAIRFLYATQTAVRPPTFIFFCNEPRAVQASYRRFLENKLREAFDFRGTPVRIRLRARSRAGRPDGAPRSRPKGRGPRKRRGQKRRPGN